LADGRRVCHRNQAGRRCRHVDAPQVFLLCGSVSCGLAPALGILQDIQTCEREEETESAWNLIAADAGHQDINGCNLDHLDIHGNYYWGTCGLVESESVIISDYELEIVFNVWTDQHEDDVDCESKWFVTIPQRSLYQFGEWIWECDIELYYSSDILGLVKENTNDGKTALDLLSSKPLPDSHPLFNQYVVGGRGFNRPKKDKQEGDQRSQD
tara:strand:+ start:127 stop:762 length:636 start_codon:yes stop_codon:yes gene_type:complete